MSTNDILNNDKQPIADAKTLQLKTLSSHLKTAAPMKKETIQRPTISPSHRSGPIYKRRSVVISMLCLVALLAGGSFFAWHLIKQAPTNVTLYQTSMNNVNRYIGGSGIIYPLQELNIAYPAVERVLSVYVKPGDEVSPNQSLIQLDISQLNAQIKQASDNVAAAQNYLNSVASDNPLVVDQAQRSYDMALASYNSLVAQAASPTLHHGILISPLKGVVTHVNIDAGEVAGANSTLITLIVESTVIAHVQIPLSNINQVYIGQAAVVTPSALPNLSLQGSVSTIIPQASADGNTFEVWINVVNTQKELLPGMNTFVRLLEPVHAIVVPRLAVLNPDQGATVYVVRQGRAYVQHIQVGGYAGDYIIVNSGLSIGDRIVLTGNDTLQDGQPVDVISTEQYTKQ